MHEAPSQDEEGLVVAVTGLNLEHARAGLRPDQVTYSTKRTPNLLSEEEDRDRVIKKQKRKKKDLCDFL